MPKTIALAKPNSKLASELAAHGFRVLDGVYQSSTGQAADIYLYTSYRPTTEACLTAHTEYADISIGHYHYTTTDHPATIMLNITGLNPSQIIDRVQHELARRPRL
ncbi:hypothetical protein [Sporomusa aerivorans]|uniref:hypothetical protein n=1 Tax=Sporomusa aerivorans TaxID=204936 RepID=UPI00352B13EA